MDKARYVTDQLTDGEPAELVIQFTEEGWWKVGTAPQDTTPTNWVIIDPETAPAPVSAAIADLFHGIRSTI